MRTNVAVRALAPVLCWVPITCMWELVMEPRDLRDGHWNEVIRVHFLESRVIFALFSVLFQTSAKFEIVLRKVDCVFLWVTKRQLKDPCIFQKRLPLHYRTLVVLPGVDRCRGGRHWYGVRVEKS
jgi:hypothetical protein